MVDYTLSSSTLYFMVHFQAVEKGYNLDYHSFHDYEKRRYGQLLSELFMAEWKKNVRIEDEIRMLRHSLRWPPFPQYLKIYCKF